MRRTVTADLHVDVLDPARLAVQVAVSRPEECGADERIELTVDGAAVPYQEVGTPTGGRMWVLDLQPGTLHVGYHAVLQATPPPPPVELGEELMYLRPSRYCESDRIGGLASKLFRDLREPRDVLPAVSSWVGTNLDYVSGSSGPTDGAVDTLLAGQGVCRDFAHLAVSLLRALDVPARIAAVYAPGLDPMDFHAVAEALVDGAWYVVDGTLLAPRESLARIATGRDAADTSFLSSYGGAVVLTGMEVTATVDGDLPVEDVQALVALR